MSFITDIRAVSESALNQLSDRFADLPRPLLAAIGAGDLAVATLAELRESLAQGWDLAPVSAARMPDAEDVKDAALEVREFAEDLPAKLHKAASDVIESMEKFVSDAPAKTQQLVAELPDKVTEIRQALSAEQLREAVDGYTQLAGAIYGSLADRGDKTWAKVTATHESPASAEADGEPAAHGSAVATTPVRAVAIKPASTVEQVAAKPAKAAKPAAAKAVAVKAPAVKVPAVKAPAAKQVIHDAATTAETEADVAAKIAAAKEIAAELAEKAAKAKPSAPKARAVRAQAKPGPKPAARTTKAP
ncbi:hypothetical protein EH165_13025 [Nakamurella antarctica]|uniref:Heparin binding hemagglutinin HbhA n=1 Tax=Nakamurella antarctica TaxID=1902245 RepID=A0A3G8ZWV7_9ACTN|nr:hypothetical protein [Nakamurella antarctica]AZI58924.1 hypothetical protein EH165_13025 [Nakamurella antarctica]